MEPTLFSFIWKHSKRQQLLLFALTLVSFPFLYASLELPKRIINDAIGAESATVMVLGYELSQVQFLLALCFAFLGTVLASGLMKMRINTMKGVLAERLLRRLRYQLISRMMRFPSPYFRKTSQGELVSMITSEAEPMGGLMGDAVAQPAFQFGQMMTILVFLFAQSVWFGLASVALIPLQAWLIPMLQRQINLLNKDRIVEIRALSSEIGESAAGISDLRANGGWRYRLAQVSDRLGRLFQIRFRIYQKKFFMKFLNNLITQMTPFLFYSVGGYLAIKGEITVGALVAALAAYKDLSSPWKELLFYYNQVQDMNLRWDVVMDKFQPKGMIDEALFDDTPETLPHLRGDIVLKDISVQDRDGHPVLEDISLVVPAGSRVAIKSSRASERTALAQVLTRELMPTRGHVEMAGLRLDQLHQAVIAARIGYAHSRPYLFDGTLGENLMMPLRLRPVGGAKNARTVVEAKRAGNSGDSLEGDWIDPALAGLGDGEDIRDWWFKLLEAMGIDELMFRRTLRSRFDGVLHGDLATRIVALRPQVRARLIEAGLGDVVHHFDPDTFNPSLPLGGNLLFAAPARHIAPRALASDSRFIAMLMDNGLARDGLEIARGVVETLAQTFGRDGIDHPLFRKLGIEEDVYHRLLEIAALGTGALADADRALMLTVPFLLSAEQIGPGFPDAFKDKIMALRRDRSELMRGLVGDMFLALSPDTYLPRSSVLENAIYGRVSMSAGARGDAVEDVVAQVLSEAGLREEISAIIYDLPAGLGGANLPAVFQERAAFSRAAIKRPDVLIMDKALASHDSQSRLLTRQKLRDLLPEATVIFMEDHFEHPEAYDFYVEIKDGRIDGVARAEESEVGLKGAADFSRKLAIIAETELFGQLDARNQRLLAFSAQWYEACEGQVVFGIDQVADAAYLC
ncbi:MAG: ABC transporter transmembrane domain-containing protein, partial [Sedimentitalea sp.]